MTINYIIPVSNGLFDHRDSLGSALWEFLWCIDAISGEEVDKEGTKWGLVHNGVPVNHARIARESNTSVRTVKRNMAILKEKGYISTVRVARGEIIKVAKNKKEIELKRCAIFGTSHERDVPNMAHHQEEITKNGLSDESDVPNIVHLKDFKDLSFSSSVLSEHEIMEMVKEVENHFIIKRNSGLVISPEDFNAMRTAIADGIPVETIKSAIDQSFAKYKPKHRLDKIRTFTYCAPSCYDAWTKEQAITETLEPVALGDPITENVPSEPVAPGITRKSKQQIANEKLLREIKEAEELESKRA